MGEPIYLTKGKDKMTVYGRHQAAVHVGEGWKLAGDSESISLPPVPINATDGAKEMAEEYGVDLTTVKGTGKDGRILLIDVRAVIDGDS